MDLTSALLQEGMIRVKQPANSWEEAVKIGIGCLVSGKKADWKYYHAIINSVGKNGPYFVLMPGVALPHARPTDGAIADGFSLVTLAKPIDFGSPENDPISILLSFCATDASVQVESALAQAVTLFEDEENIERMIHASSVGEIEKILQTVKENRDDD